MSNLPFISKIDLSIAGRTAHFVDAWARLTKDQWVLSTVGYGL
jgi:hypothetical protein